MIRRAGIVGVLALTSLLVPTLAHAQTAMSGTVKDTSGGVLPGVTVEATSPVLIEGTKSAATDGEGRFTIIDLRPGTYVVTFTLTGFQTVKVDGVIVEADVTRTVNADMKLGTVSEALTVSGAAPVVDVSNAVRITSLERSVLDNMPVGNNIWEMAQLIPAIDMYMDGIRRASSVAGSNGATQTYMSVNGGEAKNNVVMVDGMTVSGLEFDGTVQAYFNQDMNSEVSYQTSGISADRSGGGVTVNMVPREGGNRFSGDGKFSYKPDSWIASNTTDRIKAMGLTSESSLKFLSDFTISEGGPILRNKLWFFGSFHQFNTSDYYPFVFRDDGSQFDGPQRIRQGSLRLTYQMTPRTKLTGYYDKTQKLVEGNGITTYDDPETAAWTFKTPNYGTGNVKVTSTLTSRLLLEGGYSMNREDRDEVNLGSVVAPRGTPEWYEVVNKNGFNHGAMNTAGYASKVQNHPHRDNYQGSVSYVTGAHQIKAGVQWQTGTFYHSNDTNGDLWAYYLISTPARCPAGSGCSNAELVPDSTQDPTRVVEWKLTSPSFILGWNTPTQSEEQMNKDIGIYVQDSWRVKRLTINPGLRWEHLNAENAPFSTTEGRWAMARSIDGVRNVPNWYDWSPRFNAVWDVFGNARTAVKYSINRYNYGAAVYLASTFNVMQVASRVMLWNDKNGNDYPDGSPGFVYNDQGIATGYGPGFCTTAMFAAAGNPCELNMQSLITTSTGAMFGTPAAEQEYQGYPRQYIFEQIFEVQHALTRRLSLTFSYTRGDYKDRVATVNLARQPDDYVPVTVFNPVDGTPVTKWSVKDAATQLRLENNASNLTYLEPANLYRPKTLALEFRMRPFAGAQIFGGFTMQRFDYTSTCESSVAGAIVNPNSTRHCDTWNLSAIDDHGLYDSERSELQANGLTIPTLGYKGTGISMDSGGTMPFSKDFRVGISLPLPWYGINLGVSYLNNDEGGVTMAYSVTYANTGFVSATCLGGATRYPDGSSACTGTSTSADQVIPGISRNHKIAFSTIAAACPTPDNGGAGNCTPGGFIVQPGSYRAGVSGTSFSFNLLPGGPTTRNKRERLNQLDLKVSKTFRVQNISILPTLEVGNLFNQDKITGYSSANYAETGGTYNIPSVLLQSRIVGFGVQVRW